VKETMGWKLGIGFMLAVLSAAVEARMTKEDTAATMVHEARQKTLEGDREKAALLYYQALQIDKSHPEASRELAALVIHAEAGNRDEYSDVLQTIEQKVSEPTFLPTNFSLSYLRNAELSATDAAMSRSVMQILSKLQSNDNQMAVRLAKVLQKENPLHPVPYNLLGLAWQGIGDPTKAREYFEKAIILKDSFHAARINLAELELHLGEFGAAHQELDTVLKADDHNRRACLVKSHLYALEKQLDLAKQWYSKVSEQL